jgi:hypothetical protein
MASQQALRVAHSFRCRLVRRDTGEVALSDKSIHEFDAFGARAVKL